MLKRDLVRKGLQAFPSQLPHCASVCALYIADSCQYWVVEYMSPLTAITEMAVAFGRWPSPGCICFGPTLSLFYLLVYCWSSMTMGEKGIFHLLVCHPTGHNGWAIPGQSLEPIAPFWLPTGESGAQAWDHLPLFFQAQDRGLIRSRATRTQIRSLIQDIGITGCGLTYNTTMPTLS